MTDLSFNHLQRALVPLFIVFCFPLQSVFASSKEHDGKIIREIIVEVKDVFEQTGNFFFEGANQLKVNTRDNVVRRELLLEEGEPYEQFLANESLRNLRTLRFLRRWKITPVPVPNMPSHVDVFVSVQDTWTLIPQAAFSSGDGRDRLAAGISESNALGFGKRLEFLYEEDDSRESFSGVYDSRRFFNYDADFLLGLFKRDDGDRYIFGLNKPFRTLVDTYAWSTSGGVEDVIGRLFENGDERFIFRRDAVNFGGRYTISKGDPRSEVRRYSFGYQYISEEFSSADADDFDDLDLDPNELDQDPALLASDRRFSGLVLSLERIENDFISLNYIDRFDRVEDYNLGTTYSFSAFIAPDFLGSRDDSLILTSTRSGGWRFGEAEFLRGEISLSSRLVDGGFENSLGRAELRYYNSLGYKSAFNGAIPLGRHTLAASLVLDLGDQLDNDRELLVGGDNFIRGYKARTFTGDQRFGLNLEDRFVIAEDVFRLVSIGGAFFFDAASANEGSFGEMFTDDFYSNVGFGLRFAFPRSSGGSVLRVELALPLREGPDGSERFEPRILFSGGQLFSSFLGSERSGRSQATTAIGFDR